MTHLQNVPHVLEYGITHKDSPNANPDYIDIGDSSLINSRGAKLMWVNNGDKFSFEHEQITLGNFIPFYFGFRMPMLYVIQNGYNGVKMQPPESIVYCVCTLQKIIDDGYSYYFTDGHAIDSLSSCFDSTMVNDIENIIDFEAAKTRDWTAQRDLKRKKEAEFLLGQDILKGSMAGFICYNDDTKNKLIKMGVKETIVHTNAHYYF